MGFEITQSFMFQMSQYVPTSSHSDVQSDMARHDEEGSGGYRDDIDDEEYSNIGGSGDGSGEGTIFDDYFMKQISKQPFSMFFSRTNRTENAQSQQQ